MHSMKSKIATALALLLLPVGVAACGGSDEADGSEDGGSGGGSVDVVAYSTPQEAYEEGLFPAFNATPDGEGVEFSASFAGSGDQSRAVEAGQPADLVHFSLETDMTRVVDAGMVAEDWNAGKYKGIVENSVVVFVVRPGNPNDIRTWDDVANGENEIITPNPFQSGGARWNLMAGYGHVVQNGGSEEEGLDFIRTILENTSVQDASARDALGTFTGGKGDVMLAYENEAIAAQEAGEDVEYVIPDDTLLIETPAAVTENAQDPEAAQAFLDYQLSPEGQQVWADYGYRPVDEEVLKQNADKFPVVPELFTIEDLGGWEQIAAEFFDTENGSVAAIESDLGAPLE
jgi:sulfate/thiosulfate transport system substrate-binding protein